MSHRINFKISFLCIMTILFGLMLTQSTEAVVFNPTQSNTSSALYKTVDVSSNLQNVTFFGMYFESPTLTCSNDNNDYSQLNISSNNTVILPYETYNGKSICIKEVGTTSYNDFWRSSGQTQVIGGITMENVIVSPDPGNSSAYANISTIDINPGSNTASDSNISSLITAYRYRFVDDLLDCNNNGGQGSANNWLSTFIPTAQATMASYSAKIPFSTDINVATVDPGDGPKRLCLVAAGSDGQQLLTNAKKLAWNQDSTGPVVNNIIYTNPFSSVDMSFSVEDAGVGTNITTLRVEFEDPNTPQSPDLVLSGSGGCILNGSRWDCQKTSQSLITGNYSMTITVSDLLGNTFTTNPQTYLINTSLPANIDELVIVDYNDTVGSETITLQWLEPLTNAPSSYYFYYEEMGNNPTGTLPTVNKVNAVPLSSNSSNIIRTTANASNNSGRTVMQYVLNINNLPAPTNPVNSVNLKGNNYFFTIHGQNTLGAFNQQSPIAYMWGDVMRSRTSTEINSNIPISQVAAGFNTPVIYPDYTVTEEDAHRVRYYVSNSSLHPIIYSGGADVMRDRTSAEINVNVFPSQVASGFLSPNIYPNNSIEETDAWRLRYHIGSPQLHSLPFF